MSVVVLVLIATVCASATADLKGGLTADFQNWLRQNGYSEWVSKFVRDDLNGYGSYGGKRSSWQAVSHEPVIFIHGNSDQALKDPAHSGIMSKYQTGWDDSINYFTQKGYTSAELYATTWGKANPMQSSENTHSCEYTKHLRKFIEAVIAYTGAQKVDVISHSMGVTLARKVLKGGQQHDYPSGSCNLGSALTDKVDTFVGIAGGNRGLASCVNSAMIVPSCNTINGYFPGWCWWGICPGVVPGMSTFLKDLTASSHYEGSHVYSFWSHADDVIKFGDIVWGYPTSQIDGQDGEGTSPTKTHMQLKENTASSQYKAVVNHSVGPL